MDPTAGWNISLSNTNVDVVAQNLLSCSNIGQRNLVALRHCIQKHQRLGSHSFLNTITRF